MERKRKRRLLKTIRRAVFYRIFALAVLLVCLVFSWAPLIGAFTENSSTGSEDRLMLTISEFYSRWAEVIRESISVAIFGHLPEKIENKL